MLNLSEETKTTPSADIWIKKPTRTKKALRFLTALQVHKISDVTIFHMAWKISFKIGKKKVKFFFYLISTKKQSGATPLNHSIAIYQTKFNRFDTSSKRSYAPIVRYNTNKTKRQKSKKNENWKKENMKN